ncbi:MAG: MMPL family transporter [Myxococcota bacterium]
MYVPIVARPQNHRIAEEIRAVIAGMQGEEKYFITGLPVAEDTFGVEMFEQMAITAPAAGAVIFILLWVFFRSVSLIVAPMLLAMSTVLLTMGAVTGLGFTVHIMTSMIPIFLMPIAVVDSVHILSELSDTLGRYPNPKQATLGVLRTLFSPMLYTSLTSCAGFASLALAPIPPVRTFGLFVAAGIMTAFLLTITFLPAYVALLRPEQLAAMHSKKDSSHSAIAWIQQRLASLTGKYSKAILVCVLALLAVSVYGISRIQINDNPVRWFRPSHEIRLADRILNEHFAGTYNAFLVLDAPPVTSFRQQMHQRITAVLKNDQALEQARLRSYQQFRDKVASKPLEVELALLIEHVSDSLDSLPHEDVSVWEQVLAILENAQVDMKYFQTPAALKYIEDLQKALLRSGVVGKSNSLTDIVKTVHRDLRQGYKEHFSIPKTTASVAQTILTFQSSHRPTDLWHTVTPEFRSTALWIQLKSGDNRDMQTLMAALDRFLIQSPPPDGVTFHWAGLTFLNVIWQREMVAGMLSSLIGSFIIVFFMMLFLFRSLPYALAAMLPLSCTIALIYGAIGLVGKDYDMPVAVLSSRLLGLSVDFAVLLAAGTKYPCRRERRSRHHGPTFW